MAFLLSLSCMRPVMILLEMSSMLLVRQQGERGSEALFNLYLIICVNASVHLVLFLRVLTFVNGILDYKNKCNVDLCRNATIPLAS